MNFKDEIAKLVQLQEIDSRIYFLNEEKNKRLPLDLSNLKREFEEKKKEFSVAEEKFKNQQLKRKEKEIELSSKEENLKKAQGQLYQLKTNKEYQAKLSEIASIKADVSLAEEEILKVMEETERSKAEVEEEKKNLAEEEKKYNEKESQVAQKIKTADIEIKNLKDKRSIYTKDIEPQLLKKYETLIGSRQGLAIVPVNNSNCGACYLNVTHQVINEIKMYERPVICGNCVRILYIPEDLQL